MTKRVPAFQGNVRFRVTFFLFRIKKMEVLNSNIALFTPKLSVIGSCNAQFDVSKYRTKYRTKKKVEFSNEILISDALTAYYNLTSYEDSDIVVYNECPYSRHMHTDESDPFVEARTFNENEIDERPITDQKPCVYMALHPLSYPTNFNKMRFCTALVEDKTVNGDDEDLVVPSGSLKYPVVDGMERSCLLSYFGSRHQSKEFNNIRLKVSDEIDHLNFSKACNINAVDAEYVRAIQRSKFCFALPGDTRGGEKLAISIMNDCIPIIEHYSWNHLPFFKYLNYSKFAIRMEKKWSMSHLVSAIEGSDYAQMLDNLKKAQLWFDYTRHDFMSPHTLIWNAVYDIWEQ